MKKIKIIGHADQGKTTLIAEIKKSDLENKIAEIKSDLKNKDVFKAEFEEVFEFKNTRFFYEKKTTSKSRLKKCEKGLHEFSETRFLENNIKKWACIHCGAFMHNR
jgi:translation initiation factor IF-2